MFTRRSDLDRHFRTQHSPEPLRFDCPKRRCIRKGDRGFTRLDHLNKHLRNYHLDTKTPTRVHLETGDRSSARHDGYAYRGILGPREKPFQLERSLDLDEDILKGGEINPPKYPDWPSAPSSSGLTTRRSKPVEDVDPTFIQYAIYTNELLLANGVKPHQLSATHFNSFQQLPPELQRKTIETYVQNLREHQREATDEDNSACDVLPLSGLAHMPDIDEAISGYQIQLMLLEQHDERPLMARQQDSLTPTAWALPTTTDASHVGPTGPHQSQPSGSKKRKAASEGEKPAQR
ncbi:hypothetical protein GP486_007199 [Trichoglossum hirsutum]|uniref:C2H2-type domain-containing protein n=1 Tax=Trichoglossum hirsutum TaxID=265104 RepID=A0A9P8IG60_9PEZI|nr:hypothetical protein GP486_007199 [Trichoglossum hirsutum]